MVVSTIHWHEAAMSAYVSHHPEPLHPPHPIPLGCPRAPALGSLLHSSNLHWSSILHMVIHMFQCCRLTLSYPYLLPRSPKVQKSVPYICVSFAVFFFFLPFFFFYLWRILSYIEMKQPRVYMRSPSQSPLPPPSPPIPSRPSQCTRSEHLSHASNLGWWSVSP